MAFNGYAIPLILYSYGLAGGPPLKPEFDLASCSAVKKGSCLEILIKTPKIGSLEFKLIGDSAKGYVPDKLNYYSHYGRLLWIYYSTAQTAVQPPSNINYSLTIKDNRLFLHIEEVALGKMKLILSPKARGYYISHASAYDAAGTRVFSYRRILLKGSGVSSPSSGKKHP